MRVDKPLEKEGFKVDGSEDNEGLIVGRLTVDRVEVKEDLSVESVADRFEGSKGSNEDAVGKVGVAVCP